MTKTNAQRFISAYNTIDYALRAQYGFKQGMSFSEVIRKTVSLDSVVRKYEDALVDYGRLRNAIIHRSNEEYVIAEPHLDVVEDFERIAHLITTPPKVIDVVCKGPVTSVQGDLKVKDVIQIISQTGFSNIPVSLNNEIIGVANGQRIINHLGKAVAKGENLEDYAAKKEIADLVRNENIASPYYVVADVNLTIEQALNLFYTNRKLLVILITKSGNFQEMPIGIVTVADIMDMNKIIENY